MLDFEAVKRKEMTFNQLIDGLTRDDLRRLTDEMIDTQLGLIAGCVDADVTFQPVDPEANDPHAVEGEADLAWTLAHVIVHATASSEESAFLAAELARGVEFHGRSRREVPWRSVIALAQVRARLEESRRMRKASLDLWPDDPQLDNRYQPSPVSGPVNAIGRFVFGLRHDHNHLGQIAEIVRQAKQARS